MQLPWARPQPRLLGPSSIGPLRSSGVIHRASCCGDAGPAAHFGHTDLPEGTTSGPGVRLGFDADHRRSGETSRIAIEKSITYLDAVGHSMTLRVIRSCRNSDIMGMVARRYYYPCNPGQDYNLLINQALKTTFGKKN